MTGEFMWLRPLFLYGLALLPFFAVLRLTVIRRRSVAYAPLQYHAPTGPRRLAIPAAVLLETLCLVAVLTALAGPALRHASTTVTQEGVDAVLVLDISASMQAADFPPNRLECLKRLATGFVRRSGTNRIGVFAFAGDCFTQSPFTTDHAVLAELIEGLDYTSINHSTSGGTAVGDALVTATKALLRVRVPDRDQALILITDGQSNRGIQPETAIKYLRENGIRFYAVGVGGEKPVKVFVKGKPFINTEGQQLETSLDDTELRKLAALGDGRFYRATDADVLQRVFAEMARLETGPVTAETRRRTEALASWASLAGLCIFVGWFGLWGLAVRRPFR